MTLTAEEERTRLNNRKQGEYITDVESLRYHLAPLARYQLSSGGFLYVAEAEPGTALTDTKWRVWRQTNTTTTNRIEWAGGSGAFVNAANDLTSLSYS